MLLLCISKQPLVKKFYFVTFSRIEKVMENEFP